MVRTTTAAILSTWERAYGLGPVERGLALLSIAHPSEPLEQLAHWPIGRRDAALLDLRARLFGQALQSVVSCVRCGVRIELAFSTTDIRVTQPQSLAEPLFGEAVGDVLELRPPSSIDLLAVANLPCDQRRSALLRRCVRGPQSQGDVPLNSADEAAAIQRLAAADPQADIRLAIDCPACQHAWSSRFDIVQYLWAEISVWAQRLLAEVHALALGYGWRETDILALTPWRRQIYLEMLRR